MSDFKKLLKEHDRADFERDQRRNEAWRNSDSYRIGAGYSAKARRLLPFAARVLQEFAREAGCKLESGGTYAQGRSCLAYYTLNKYEGFFGNKKRQCAEIIIGSQAQQRAFGADAGAVLTLNSREYGNNESDQTITEDWFRRQLVNAFSHLLRR